MNRLIKIIPFENISLMWENFNMVVQKETEGLLKNNFAF